MKPEPPFCLLVSAAAELGNGQWDVPVSRTRDMFVVFGSFETFFEVTVVAGFECVYKVV